MSDYELTTNLHLYKPTVDAAEDIWGDLTNTNWDTLDSLLQYGAGVAVGDTPPPIKPGAMWFDSVSTQLYVAYQDPTGGPQWVIANNTGMSGSYLPLGGGTVTGLTSFVAGLTVNGTMTLDRTAAAAVANALANVYTGTLSVADPYTNQIFQRDTRTGGLYGKGIGTILLTITPSQPVSVLEHRLRDAASPSTILQDWTISVPPLSAGSQTVALTAPAGLVKYLVDIRANRDVIVSTTHACMVGELIAFAGQSLAEDMVTNAASGDPSTVAGNGLTVSPWNFVFASYASNTGAYPPIADGPDQFYPPTQFLAPGGGTYPSTFAAEFCNRLIALAGVPCAMIGYAVGGTGIDSWLPGYTGPNPGHWDKLVNILTLAGGKFGTFIWDQGHYETKNGNTSTNYYNQLALLESNVDIAFPNANYFSIVATIPGIGSYGSGPSYIEMVRATAKQYASVTALTGYVDGYDATLWSDLVHPSQAGNIPYARHFYREAAYRMGLLSRGDKGPVITGGTRAYGSVNIVLTATQTNGGTAWVSVGAPATQFTVYPAGTTASPVALDGTTPVDLTNPAQITIKLAAAPTEPQAYDVWYRRPPDTATIVGAGIYDNVTDSDGLTQGRQLWDTATAIQIAAPTISLVISTIADTTPSASITVNGTYSPVAPSSLDYSLDGGTTWVAAGATIGSGVFSFTITAPAQPALYKVRIRDHVITGNTGASNAFLVALASPPVLPSLSNQIFAFDAYAIRGSAYMDTAMTVQAAMGDTVQGLVDASGSNNNFNQPTLSAAPRLIANVKNSLPGLRFTGSLQQFLLQSSGTIANTLRTSTGYVILLVATPATLPTAAYQEFVAFGRMSGAGGSKVRLHQLTSGIVRASRNNDTGAINNVASPSAVTANTLVRLVTRWDGTNIKLVVNAMAEATTVVTGAFTAAWTESSEIGALPNSPTDGFFDGWIHEVRVWNTLASDTDRTNLLTYATSKWGT